KGPLRGGPAHARSHKDRCRARSGFGGVARVEPTDCRMIDVVGKRDLAQLCPATRRATARAVSSFAASRRGLAFERAHFSPDPLNGGSPDAQSGAVLLELSPSRMRDSGWDQLPPDVRFAGEALQKMRAPPWIAIYLNQPLTEKPSCEAGHMT